MERSLELERLETREHQVAQAEDVVGAREARVQEEVLRHEEALTLEATERNLELERLETRERQIAQAEDAVGAREAMA